jgi:hypothetical protein
LVQAIVTAMTGNANFATPEPTLPSVTTAIDDLANAETATQARTRGAAAAGNDKLATLVQILEQLKAYIQTTADANMENGAPPPVGVREREHAEHVDEELASDRDHKLRCPREVGLRRLTGPVLLRKDDLLSPPPKICPLANGEPTPPHAHASRLSTAPCCIELLSVPDDHDVNPQGAMMTHCAVEARQAVVPSTHVPLSESRKRGTLARGAPNPSSRVIEQRA